MKTLIIAIGIMLAGCSLSHAESVPAQCTLNIKGRNVLHGKCCVEISTNNFHTILAAQSWRACVYRAKHPRNALLPTYKQKCLGPWINIFEEKAESGSDKALHAYWSIEDACHGDETDEGVVKTGDGTYRGDRFRFTWKPTH